MHATDTTNQKEKILLLELQNGDSSAFDALYNQYWDVVYSNAYKRVKDMDVAKDITQEIFFKLWNNRVTAKIKNLPAYLQTAVKNAVYNWFERTKKYIPVTELIIDTEVSADSADSRVLKNELLRTFEAQVKKLTSSQQVIFKMRYDQDDTTAEIALKLGISRKTVQNQIGKSLVFLREAMLLFF